MPSERQQTRGYPLPEQITGHDLICVRLKIPNDPDYKAAFYGALTELTKWWSWEKTGDTKGSEAAAYWRELIYLYLRYADCDELDLFGGGMGDFGMCWFTDQDGNRVLRWTLNGGCNWHDVTDCSDSFPSDPVTGTNPIDDPITTPDLNGTFTNCQIVNSTIYDLVTFRMNGFATQVIGAGWSGLCENVASARTALSAWLAARGMLEADYYDAFWALGVRYCDIGDMFLDIMSEEPIWDYLKCEALLCLNGEITRSALSCIADAMDAFAPTIYTEIQFATFRQFFKEFVSIYPVEVLRRYTLNIVPSSVSDDCTSCDVTPVAECDTVQLFQWKYEPVENNLGWITISDGAANQFNNGDVDFGIRILTPMSRYYGVGWRVFTGQSSAPLYAGAVQKNFDAPYRLCQFYSVGYASTGWVNTRLTSAWARIAGTSELVCLGSKKNKAGDQGIGIINWQGDLTIDQLIVAGASGGGYWQLEQVQINWSSVV